VAPILIGCSRVVVGVHYPTDVLVGWILGLLVVLLVALIFDKIPEEKWWIAHIAMFVAGCGGFFYCKTDDYYSALGLLGGFFLAWAFDRRFVNFKTTKLPVRAIVRVLAGGAIFFAMTKILKLPFSSEFLDSGSLAAHIVRTLRYMISLFVATGVYPMIFAKLDGFWKEK
jgi:undecaprenyl-diphosphatase